MIVSTAQKYRPLLIAAVAVIALPFRSCGIEAGRGAAPQIMRIACSTTSASPNVSSSDRIGSAA